MSTCVRFAIEPNTADVRVTVDQTGVSRSIPVIFHTRGQVAEGYNLTSFSLDQSTVRVEGPLDLVQALTGIDTEEFDLSAA